MIGSNRWQAAAPAFFCLPGGLGTSDPRVLEKVSSVPPHMYLGTLVPPGFFAFYCSNVSFYIPTRHLPRISAAGRKP